MFLLCQCSDLQALLMSHADLQIAEQSALDELKQAKSVSKQAIAASEACASQVSLLPEHSLHMAVFFLTKEKGERIL